MGFRRWLIFRVFLGRMEFIRECVREGSLRLNVVKNIYFLGAFYVFGFLSKINLFENFGLVFRNGLLI